MTGSRETRRMNDPFAVLDLPEDADDDAIQKRYLALVRRHSPEREPERFAELRAAYESDPRPARTGRLRLLGIHGGALMRLKRACLEAAARHAGPAAAPSTPCCAMAPSGSGPTPSCGARKRERDRGRDVERGPG